MLERFLSLDHRRRQLLRRAPPGPLREFLATPFPPDKAPSRGIGYLALDLETTGGDPRCDEIVSFGWVCLDGLRIELASARHRVLRLAGSMTETSAVIHRITDDEAASGLPLEAVLAELLRALAGRVLIAHRALTELGFIEQACRRVYDADIVIPAVDTLQIAAAARARQQQPLRRGELRLAALRHGYNLPRYPAHNALSDALAAAELFLAQLAERDPDLLLRRLLFRR